MDRKRLIGLALCVASLALVVWGLFVARLPNGATVIRIDFPPAETAPTKPKPAPRPVTISIEGSGKVTVREGAPDRRGAEPARPTKP